MTELQEEKKQDSPEQKEQSKNIPLFGGEPVITVKLGQDGIYRFATRKSGCFDLGSIKALRDYMKRYGYKFIIVDDNTPLEELNDN